MKTKIVISLLATFLIVSVAINFYLGSQLISLQNPPESAFSFDFKFGVGAKNELNTFNHTFTHDMVCDPAITINMTLTQDEMNSIYMKMKDIGFFFFTQNDLNYSNDTICVVEPLTSYYLKVNCNGTIKELYWDDNTFCNLHNTGNLKVLTDYIFQIIQSHSEYQQLPQPPCAYL